MAKLLFDDEFNSLQLWNGSSGTWQTSYSWSPSGYSADDMSSWFVNPLYGPTSAPDANPYSVANGVLSMKIMPRPADVSPAQVGNRNYLSGMLTTYPSFSREYGYFEMRAEMSEAPGTMSAFWLLPSNGSWPPELDVAEVLGNQPTMLATTAHTATQGSQLQKLTAVADMSKGFHTYALDWQVNTITWYFDGKQVYQIATPSDMHQPMYVLLDTASGAAGSWEGTPSTGLPAAMQVDYLRVYDSNPYTGITALAPLPALTTASGGSMKDAAGNVWTLTAGGDVVENGKPVPGSEGTAGFTIVNNVYYGLDAGGSGWYTYSPSNGSWTSSAAPKIPAPTLGLTTASGGSMKDTAGNVWTLTAGGNIAKNGQQIPGGEGTAGFTIVNNVCYGMDASGSGWYSYNPSNSSWTHSTAPTISINQTAETVPLSAVTIVATSGNNLVFIAGSNNSISLSGGTDTITDTGHGNTYRLPAAGKGYDTFANNILTNGDTLDLRPALATTNWNGSTSTLSGYLSVRDTTQAAILSVSQTSGGVGAAIATIGGATTAHLSDILAHSLVR
jgi:beta-glucanase (GH16 family)